MFISKFWNKITNKVKYQHQKESERKNKNIEIFNVKYFSEIKKILENIKEKKELNFLHSGHSGDIINSLPVIKELSKTHICNLFIGVNKPIKNYYKHPANGVYLNDKIFNLLHPLLSKQKYLNIVKKFTKDQYIDINFDIIRELPINLLFDNLRYASILTNVFPSYSEPYLEVNKHKTLVDKIIIQRTFRYRNEFINYSFMSKYNNLIFVGTEEEFIDLKKSIKNLDFYECADFLDMASVIKSSRFVIANSSLVFPIAEGLMVPRILESCPSFPAAQPHGPKGYNFYFQNQFENLFDLLNK